MTFNAKLFIYLFFGFIVATVVGTVSHELGHYLVARSLGYDAFINFESVALYPCQDVKPLHRMLVTLGGPLQTMLTGTISFALMLHYRKSFFCSKQLSIRQWTIIFIALFWLRQLANLCMSIAWYIQSGRLSKSDESKLSRYLDLPHGTLSLLTATVAAILLYIVLFIFIPSRQRFTFMAAGLVGGMAGYYLWLHSLGKMVMP